MTQTKSVFKRQKKYIENNLSSAKNIHFAFVFLTVDIVRVKIFLLEQIYISDINFYNYSKNN